MPLVGLATSHHWGPDFETPRTVAPTQILLSVTFQGEEYREWVLMPSSKGLN